MAGLRAGELSDRIDWRPKLACAEVDRALDRERPWGMPEEEVGSHEPT